MTENQILGSLGGILETSWAVLAKFLTRLGPQLGSILDPKMALELPKSRPRGAYRTPKRPLGAKNHPKAAQSPPKPPREVPRPPPSLDFRGSTVAGTRLCRAEASSNRMIAYDQIHFFLAFFKCYFRFFGEGKNATKKKNK